MLPEASGHSPDGRSWWDGSQWLPAWSSDGRYWFDGVLWTLRPVPRRGGPVTWPRRVVVPLALWLATLSAAPVAALFATADLAPGQVLAHHVLVRFGVIAGICLATTPIMGFQLGREGRWLQTAWVAALGTGTLVLWYGTLMTSDQSDPSADNAAGAGVAIMGLPTFAALLALLATGGGAAKGIERLRARRRRVEM